MTSFYIPFALTVLSMASYHVAQKMLSTCDSPFSVLAVAYAFAALLCLGAAMVMSVSGLATPGGDAGQIVSGQICADNSFRTSLMQVFSWKNWPVLLLAVAVVGIEVGILFTYRFGASMGTLPLLTNAGLLVITVPVGVFFFREHVSVSTLMGAVCVLGGFWLMTRQA